FGIDVRAGHHDFGGDRQRVRGKRWVASIRPDPARPPAVRADLLCAGSGAADADAAGKEGGELIMNPIYASRRRVDIAVKALCFGAALFGVTWLALILFTLFYHGIAGISVQLFTQNTPPPGSTEGGLLDAIVGSVIM